MIYRGCMVKVYENPEDGAVSHHCFLRCIFHCIDNVNQYFLSIPHIWGHQLPGSIVWIVLIWSCTGICFTYKKPHHLIVYSTPFVYIMSGADAAFFVGVAETQNWGFLTHCAGSCEINCFQSWGHFSAGAGAKAPWPPPLDPPLNVK